MFANLRAVASCREAFRGAITDESQKLIGCEKTNAAGRPPLASDGGGSRNDSEVKEQLRRLLRTSSLEDAAAAKEVLEELVKAAARPETNRLYRTVCRWWKEIEVLIVTGATTGKVEANNTAIKNIKRTARGYRNAANYKSVILLRSAVRSAA